MIALNAIKSQLFGQGGGKEVQAAQLLDGLQDQLGADKGYSVWNDLRQRQDPETPVSVPGNFPYAPLPAQRTGNVVLDNGSFQRVPEPGVTAAALDEFTRAHEQRAHGRRQPVEVGPPAVRGRPPDRLLLSRA